MSQASLKERLAKKREEIKKRGGGNSNLIFIKEGTMRIRVLSVGEDEEFAWEIDQYYLGAELKGVISPTSIGMDCPIAEKAKELSKSGKDGDTELAKKLIARKRWLVPVILYADDRGKEIDHDNSGKMVLITGGLYGQIIDFYLDPDLGDFMDPQEGYDLKIKRTGKGRTDTEYTVTAMRPSPSDKEYRDEVDLEAMVKEIIPSYDEAEDILATFLAGTTDSDDDDEDTGDTGKAPVRKRRRAKA